MNNPEVCIFGEVLFDHFPDGSRVLGGAPFNVAWHLQAFGLSPRLVSRVGADSDGEAVLAAMRDWGMDTRGVQIDPQRPTGRVSVQFRDGEPAYLIEPDCAYDAIEWQPPAQPSPILLYHGSLALRAPVSCDTLQRLVREAGCDTVFLDVNLRSSWWDRDSVSRHIRSAHWLKLNQHELGLLVADDGADVASQAGTLLAESGLRGLILTLGAAGARAFTADGASLLVRPGHAENVVDTVGAGDAFAAVMILGITRGWPLPLALERAQQFAATIIGQRGATSRQREFYEPLRKAWDSTGTTGT